MLRADALGRELAGVGVDGRTLDAGASDVDPYDRAQSRAFSHAVSLYGVRLRHLRNGPLKAHGSRKMLRPCEILLSPVDY